MDDKIISRMKKLLALSQDSTSENEAMIATARLHKLLAQYNVSLMDIKDKPKEEVNEDCYESINWPWRRWVAAGISDLYFCTMYSQVTRKNHANYFFIGTKMNREYAMSMTQNIINTIEREAKIECKKFHDKTVSSYITSFRTGAGIRINSRCVDLIAQAKRGDLQDDDGSNLPVLASVYDQHKNMNNAFTDSFGIKTVKSRTRSSSEEGYNAGKLAGNRVQLNTGVQSDAAPKAIGRE